VNNSANFYKLKSLKSHKFLGPFTVGLIYAKTELQIALDTLIKNEQMLTMAID
jgi:selenocysteine lyase/cysteine desulfurase